MLEVGRVAKAHGIRGEVLVELTTDRTERVAPGAVLTTKAGAALRVERSSLHLGRWIVAFDEVPDRTAAERLHGEVLFAEPIDDPDALFVHDLIGCGVVDAATGAEIGEVVSIEANPASDLLVLGDGKLIPLHFLTERDMAARRLTVDLPEGLLDL
jgi:16S rRNA processing protein RimM